MLLHILQSSGAFNVERVHFIEKFFPIRTVLLHTILRTVECQLQLRYNTKETNKNHP